MTDTKMKKVIKLKKIIKLKEAIRDILKELSKKIVKQI